MLATGDDRLTMSETAKRAALITLVVGAIVVLALALWQLRLLVALLFLMDYANRQRVKIWGTARVTEDDAELIAKLFPKGYKARAEAAILFTVEAWDANCPQHIPQMLFAEDVAGVVVALQDRIAALEAENARLHAAATGLEP